MFILLIQNQKLIFMTDNSERNISLVGKSGNEYFGKMYEDKKNVTGISGSAIVCLSNTLWDDNHWQFNIRDIYNDDALTALEHFKERNDISHIILIPMDTETWQGIDVIDDLRRQYLINKRLNLTV